MQEVLIGHVNAHMQQLAPGLEEYQIAWQIVARSNRTPLEALSLGGARQVNSKALKIGMLDKGRTIDAMSIIAAQPIGNPAPLSVMVQQFPGDRIGCFQLYLRCHLAAVTTAAGQHH